MTTRKGEQAAWIAGWVAGFCWLGIAALVFLFQDKPVAPVIGGALSAAGILGTFLLSPWRHPDTPYWKLMLPLYADILPGIVWVWYSCGGASGPVSRWGALALFLPVIIPLFSLGHRTWNDPRAGTPGGSENP